MGQLLYWTSGIVLFIFEMVWFYRWWDVGGVIVAFFVPPLAALFPFIFLFKEGFSLLYFGVWAVGLLGMYIASQREYA